MYEGFPGEVKTFFVRGLMFPSKEVLSSALVHGARGSVGCSSPVGATLHSGIAGSFWFFGVPLYVRLTPICSDYHRSARDWLHFGQFTHFSATANPQTIPSD